jgi:hypothetical protein
MRVGTNSKLVADCDIIFSLMPSDAPDIRLHSRNSGDAESVLVVVHKMNGLLIAAWFSMIGIPVILILAGKDAFLGFSSTVMFFVISCLTCFFYRREPKERAIAEIFVDRRIQVYPTMRVLDRISSFAVKSFKYEIRSHEFTTLYALVANSDLGDTVVVACSCYGKRINQLAKELNSLEEMRRKVIVR